MSSQSYVTGLRNACAAGIKARRAGKPLASNPYKRFEHRTAWEDGWHRAGKETTWSLPESEE